VEPELVEYLKDPPDEATLRDLARKLGLRPKEFIRRGEKEYKTLGLKDKLEDDDALFQAIAAHPRLLERPIGVKGNTAVLGRPPERILELL
jgi:arsenate reductase